MPSLEPVVGTVPVASSYISHIGHDAKRRVVAVRFVTGVVVYHHDVPPELAQAFEDAPSKGKFYGMALRGKHNPVVQTGACPKCGDGPGFIGELCGSCGCDDYAAVEKKAKKEAK